MSRAREFESSSAASARPLRRVEDARLLTGGGRYLSDLEAAGAADAMFVRSNHAHARLGSIASERAASAPGVLAVYTGADLAARGIDAIPFRQLPPNPRAVPLKAPPRMPLATDRVRYVGDTVALVVAETLAQAQDAAELIEIDYDPIAPAPDPRTAVRAGAPNIWPDCPGNVAGVWEEGDAAAVDAAFAGAARVAAVEVINNRLVPTSLEPRGALCEYDGASGRYTLHVGCQMPHLLKEHLARDVLHIAEQDLRVVVPDIGGGFGAKVFCYPEYAAVAVAAGDLRRPVRWIGSRSDAFLSDIHGRDQVNRAELALDADGKFLALRVRSLGNVGAYLSFQGGFIPTISSFRVLTGVYDIPLAYGRCECILTTTGPVDAYRGAGRPEAVYVLERLVDQAAAEIGMDPVALRRRNMIPRAAMPYKSAMGVTIDSGDFARVMERAMTAHDWDGFAARRQDAEARGCLAGRGQAMFIEHTGRNEHTETVTIEAHADGRIVVLSGTQEMGQGLRTSYVQLVAERLQVPADRVDIVQGDTDRVATGGGSGGSRSLFVGGSAVSSTSKALIERGKALAAGVLEAAVSDIEYAKGHFRIGGTDRAVSISDLARRQPGALLSVAETTTSGGLTWPNGCHICEVEIDRETGVIAVTRFTAVDDVGNIVNPTIVEGQAHGGIAQGIGQALLERTVYDGSGQLLSGSLMDYALPRADDLPSFTVAHDESSPCTTNLLGAKGAGECGATGAPPAVVSAVVDALRPYGVRHIDMPIRSEDVWRILCGKPRG